MTPFNYADEIKLSLLLIHVNADDNPAARGNILHILWVMDTWLEKYVKGK